MRLINADDIRVPNDAPYKATLKRLIEQQPTVCNEDEILEQLEELTKVEESIEKCIDKMDYKAVIKNMIYIEEQLDNRIHEFITNTLRKGASDKDIADIKSSLEYVIDEQFEYMKR